MKTINKLKDRKGVSPVIATVIIVAVTITVAVAVAYWISGISSQYTAFEKVEIQSAVFTTPMPVGYWEITITLKNSGTKTATLSDVYVNDERADLSADDTGPTFTSPCVIEAYLSDDGLATPVDSMPLQILSGATDDVIVWIKSGEVLSSGTTVNIKIHSAAGMDYIKLVQLS